LRRRVILDVILLAESGSQMLELILPLGLSHFASQGICLAMLLAVLIGVPYFMLFGGAERFCRKPLMRRYNGLEIHDSPDSNDVSFTYHTYRGFLLWFVQDEHSINAPPRDARVLLGRLLRFNLTYGMLSYGLLFVPLLAIGNYIAQSRNIKKQVAQHHSNQGQAG